MSEIIAECILSKRALTQWAETFTASGTGTDPFVQEVKAHFNNDGVRVAAVDPANIAMIAPATLSPRAFESYDAPGSVTIGVNLTTLLDRVGHADADDLLHLAVDMETRKLQIEYGAADLRMGLIDPEAIRSEPDAPDIDLPNTVTLTGAALAEALDIVEMVSDHVEIECDPDAREVVFRGGGDIDDATVAYGDEDLADPTDVPESTLSLFSIDYLQAFADPIPDDAAVTLALGDEFPTVWEWSALDGAFEVTEMCAPRIQSN